MSAVCTERYTPPLIEGGPTATRTARNATATRKKHEKNFNTRGKSTKHTSTYRNPTPTTSPLNEILQNFPKNPVKTLKGHAKPAPCTGPHFFAKTSEKRCEKWCDRRSLTRKIVVWHGLLNGIIWAASMLTYLVFHKFSSSHRPNPIYLWFWKRFSVSGIYQLLANRSAKIARPVDPPPIA